MRARFALSAIVLASSLAACSGPAAPVCGEGLDPVIVTGLNGVLDEATPVVEVQLRVPETCEVLDTTWMFWDEPGGVRLGEAPTEGGIDRAGVTVGDDLIFFRDANVGVRLEYPAMVIAPEVSLVWFSAGEDLAAVDCAAQGETLACAVVTP